MINYHVNPNSIFFAIGCETSEKMSYLFSKDLTLFNIAIFFWVL